MVAGPFVISRCLDKIHSFKLTAVVHRLKGCFPGVVSGNVMLTVDLKMKTRTANKLVIKLTDFGLSSRKSHSRKGIGTPFYTAPEVFMHYISSVPWSEKIDVWSLGMIGLELLWGLPQRPQHPGNGLDFQPNNLYANGWHGAIHMWKKRVLEHHILPSAIPELIVTILNMLEVDSKQRFSARKALMHLRKHSEQEYFLSPGMDPKEQAILEEAEGDGVQW